MAHCKAGSKAWISRPSPTWSLRVRIRRNSLTPWPSGWRSSKKAKPWRKVSGQGSCGRLGPDGWPWPCVRAPAIVIRIHDVAAAATATLVVGDDSVGEGDLHPVHIGPHQELAAGQGRRQQLLSKLIRQERVAGASLSRTDPSTDEGPWSCCGGGGIHGPGCQSKRVGPL